MLHIHCQRLSNTARDAISGWFRAIQSCESRHDKRNFKLKSNILLDSSPYYYVDDEHSNGQEPLSCNESRQKQEKESNAQNSEVKSRIRLSGPQLKVGGKNQETLGRKSWHSGKVKLPMRDVAKKGEKREERTRERKQKRVERESPKGVACHLFFLHLRMHCCSG